MTLISYNAIWEYQTAANTAPPDPASVTVPSAGWTSGGVSPFGTVSSVNSTATPYLPATAWAANTALWIRRNFTVDGLADVLIKGQVENAFCLYIDGVYMGGVNPDNSIRADEPTFSMIIPKAALPSGTHQIALFCMDDNITVGDTLIWLEADYLPAMIALQPMAPVKETLAWLTDVMISEDGTEDRVQSRLSPRQQLQYTYPADQLAKTRAFNTFYGARGSNWLVPLWTQATHVGAIGLEESSLTLTTSYSDYRAGSLALIWQSYDQWQVVGVDLVESASSLLLTNLTDSFTDAWVMPLREGRLSGNPEKRLDGHSAVYDATYEVSDNLAISVSAPTQYLSNDIYYEETLLSGDSLSDDIVGKPFLFDEDLGKTYQLDPWLNSRVARDYVAICEDAEEAWALRQWLTRRAGRFRQFWQPSFENDLRVANTASITTTLRVPRDEYLRWGTGRTHIAVQVGNTWYPRAITAATAVSSTMMDLTLSSSLGGVSPQSVKRVSYLGLRRLDTDRIEISWVGGGVCKTEMRTVELSG